VLASIIPGLRELRTPLAIGWIWLAALWIVFGDLLPRKGEGTNLLQSIFEIGEGLGKGIALGVAAFVAYLVGSLVQVDPASFLGINAIRRFGSKQGPWAPLSDTGRQVETVENRIRRMASDFEREDGSTNPLETLWNVLPPDHFGRPTGPRGGMH
jgi:hypothetical protein